MPGKQHHLTEEEIKSLLGFRKLGWTTTKLGEKFGVDHSTITVWLKRNGGDPLQKNAIHAEKAEEWYFLHKMGKSIKSLATENKVQYQRVHYQIRNLVPNEALQTRIREAEQAKIRDSAARRERRLGKGLRPKIKDYQYFLKQQYGRKKSLLDLLRRSGV